MSQTLMQVSVQIIGLVGKAFHQLDRLIIYDELFTESVSLGRHIICMCKIRNGNTL